MAIENLHTPHFAIAEKQYLLDDFLVLNFKIFLLPSLIYSIILSALDPFSSDPLPWVEDGAPGLELEIVRPFLPQNPVILEAGGHYGEDTAIMAQKWPNGMIHSFEPVPAYYYRLSEAVSRFPNVRTYPFGLFTTPGFYRFYVSRNWDGASSLLEDNHLPVTIYNDYQITVYCKNLDEWAMETGVDHIDYMWLDMEGAELALFQSSPKILKTVRAISCELNYREFRKGMPHFNEVTQFLKSQGFTLYKLWGLQGGPRGTWQSTGVFIRSEWIESAP